MCFLTVQTHTNYFTYYTPAKNRSRTVAEAQRTDCIVYNVRVLVFQSVREEHSVRTAREGVTVRTMPLVTLPPVNANVDQDIPEAGVKQVSSVTTTSLQGNVWCLRVSCVK